MSVIQKQPFIEKVIATLSDEQKVALLGLINGGDLEPDFKSLVNKTYNLSVSDKGVSHIILETLERTYTGYLLYTDSYCVLVSYKNIQELVMLNINPAKNTYEIVKEPLTIIELRFELGGGNGAGGDAPKKIEVNNITSLTDEQINGLNAGDLVEKKTGNQLHTYVVSYKENGTGICLTYTDASVVETVSYDYTGGHWVYNSTDITHLGGIPTVTIALSQVVSQDPIQVQLTNDQYNVFANNKQVILDMSAVGQPSVVWQYAQEDSDYIYFGVADVSSGNYYFRIEIDKSTKVAEYQTDKKYVDPSYVGTGLSADEGKLLAMDSSGYGILTNNLPILTTAPSSANSEGGLIIVVLSSEPATYYNGYLYLIQDSQV